MADLAKLVEELSALTVMEAADLSKMLEEKWGVSAAAAVAAPAAAKVEFEPVHEVKATRQAPRSRTAMPAVEMKAPAVVNYKVVNAEEFRAASKELSVAKLPRK